MCRPERGVPRYVSFYSLLYSRMIPWIQFRISSKKEYNKFYFILYLFCSYECIWMCECKVTTKIYYIYTRDSLHLSSTNFPIGAWYHWFQYINVYHWYHSVYCFWYLISSSTSVVQFYAVLLQFCLICLSFGDTIPIRERISVLVNYKSTQLLHITVLVN